MTKFVNYMQGVKTEMAHVTWPSKKELRNMSAFTIAALTVGGVSLWIIDTGIVGAMTSLAHIG